MYATTEPVSNPVYATPQSNILCKDCGSALNFYEAVGFCRICGAPLCARCLTNTVKFTNTQIEKTKEYIVAYQTQTRQTTAQVVLCRACLQTRKKSTSRWAKLVFGVSLGVLFLVLGFLAYINQLTPNVACMSVGVTALLLFLFVAMRMSEKDEEIKPVCPSCGSNAMPVLLAQNPAAGQGERTMPNFIRCVCGYAGPVTPLDGLWKYVDTRGPDALSGTPYDQVARHSWDARRQLRRT